MAVADGVGGNYGGETASRVVIAQCKKQFAEIVENPNPNNLKNHVRKIYNDSVVALDKISKKTK